MRLGTDILARGQKELSDSGVPNAPMEALWIFRACATAEDFSRMIKERKAGKPLAYVLGTAEFEGREFSVNESVLIPRPETGLLLHEALRRLGGKSMTALEIGTGSGIVAVSLALGSPASRIFAADSSAAALSTAKKNAERHGAAGKISFLESDLFARVSGKFDIIVSNPPYVKTDEIPLLQREIQFEPRAALDGGPDGLDVIRKIIKGAPLFLKSGGALLLEMGFDQSAAVSGLMGREGFKDCVCLKDEAGIDRVATGRL